jgi:hypothetical protein
MPRGMSFEPYTEKHVRKVGSCAVPSMFSNVSRVGIAEFMGRFEPHFASVWHAGTIACRQGRKGFPLLLKGALPPKKWTQALGFERKKV